MQDIKMVVASERVKLGQEWAKCLGERTACNVAIDLAASGNVTDRMQYESRTPILFDLVKDIIFCVYLLLGKRYRYEGQLGKGIYLPSTYVPCTRHGSRLSQCWRCRSSFLREARP